MSAPVYLDHHATTPLDPRVLDEMRLYLETEYGNPSNELHVLGRNAKAAVEKARDEVAGLVGARAKDVIFTAGATESDNLAIQGLLRGRRGHAITQATEHDAVFETMRAMEREGIELTVLPVDPRGLVNPEDLRRSLRRETRLVSIMRVGNEVGAVQDVAAISAIVRESEALLHVDAAQGTGLIPLDVQALGIDLLSLSAHKLYGPKGVGALVAGVRARAELRPIVFGGGQEDGLRSGTHDVAGIVGFGVAARLIRDEGVDEAARIAALRARLREQLTELTGVTSIGPADDARHPGNVYVRIEGLNAAELVRSISPDVCASTGSSCATGKDTRRIALALGLTPEEAKQTLRLCVGRFNTPEDIERAAAKIREVVARLRRT
jgi:cysteine desulfurase